MDSYSLVFTGKLRSGCNEAEALQNLCKNFTLTERAARTLFIASPKSIKANLDQRLARRMVKRLLACGWHCELHQQGLPVYSSEQLVGDSKNSALQGRVRELNSAASAVAAKSRVAPDSIQPHRTLTCANEKFTIKVPAVWEKFSHLNPNAIIQCGCSREDVYLIVIPQQKSASALGVTPVDYARGVFQSVLGWVAEAQVQAPPKLDGVDGGTYIAGELVGLIDGERVVYFISVHLYRNTFFTIYQWCREETFSQMKSVFRHNSATFSPSGQAVCVA